LGAWWPLLSDTSATCITAFEVDDSNNDEMVFSHPLGMDVTQNFFVTAAPPAWAWLVVLQASRPRDECPKTFAARAQLPQGQ